VLRFDREGQGRPEHGLADVDLAAAGRVDEADARLEPETVDVIPLDEALSPPGAAMAALGPDPSRFPRGPSGMPDAAEAVPSEISPQDIFPPRSAARPDRLILGAPAVAAKPPGPGPTEIPAT